VSAIPLLACLALLLASSAAEAGDEPAATPREVKQIRLPPADDAYGKLVRRAEAGDETVDYRELRRAFLLSPASTRARAARAELDDLRSELSKAVMAGEHQKVRDLATSILGIVYIDLDGHKFLRQACVALGDDACAAHHHALEFGLLKSILATGNGASCAAAWNVVTLEEEYFVLRVRGYTLQEQSLERGGGKTCDRMEVIEEDGAKHVVYFDATAILAREGVR
jgi:hypothetical protein